MSDSIAEHLQRPHVRPIQPIPVQKDGQTFAALRDPAMMQSRTMVVPGPAVQIIQQFRGEATLAELGERFKAPVEQLEQLVKGLDELGLLWGPTFEKMESDRWEKLQADGVFPPRASASLAARNPQNDEHADLSDADLCRHRLKQFFDEVEDPEIDETILAIVAPHLDYQRGWSNYATAYYGVQKMDAPDRVVILGTNHFGLGDGVIMTELGFETPLGRCPADTAVIEMMREKLGRPLFVDQLDHMPEHSIDLHVPFVQHCFGNVPVVAALIPDPLREMIKDDGERVDLDAFVTALRETLDALGGTTFFIASSDLSHVGPQFGEPRAVDDQRCVDVEKHDREMLSKFVAGDPEEFLGAMKWSKNSTRWCSVGNMTALLRLVDGASIELLDYQQARDERGIVMVSSAAMTLLADDA